MIRYREATRADNPALCDLERRTPLRGGDREFFFDRQDFFVVHDLQERSVVMLAEDDGEIVGACAGALNETLVGGEKRLLLYIHHERIAPERQRQGLGGALTSAISEHWKSAGVGHIDSSYWFIGPQNTASRSFASRGGSEPWPEPALNVTFETRPDGRPSPKRIGAGPIFDIVRLVNRTHEGRELFRPYTDVDLGRRLSMSSDYGWGDYYGRFAGDRLVALAGVWGRNRAMTVMARGGDGREEREVSSFIADYGYEDGAEDEMVVLLADICAAEASKGMTGLDMNIDPRSPLRDAIGALPHHAWEMLLWTPRLDLPANPGSIYLDPAFF